MQRIKVRLLKTLDEYRTCERIQMKVWGGLAVGSELLSVTQKYGGAVVGALAGRRVVGFIYAFLARRHGTLIHWSHMMAVEEGYRDKGLGLRMKLAHRRVALAQGIKSICWTYDPLQSRNATLNIRRLRARAEEYIPDCYGRFQSLIEKGLPSDRLVVNWSLTAPAAPRRSDERLISSSQDCSLVNETRRNDSGFLENRRIRFGLRERLLRVEIPANTDDMRRHARPLARKWRLETRRIFLNYFHAGYRVLDFLPPRHPFPEAPCYYLLGRNSKRRERSSEAALPRARGST
jgi:predicted GNAT superfamily acetyltransferase